jgi:sigma-B regulation protein RsbU (phosphoserine phosphatase)
VLERGHEVVAAADGEKAWHLLGVESDIDVLITDWEMPGTKGIELCRRVRAQPRGRYLPILLMTGRTEPQDLISRLDSGAEAFLRKPFDEPELLAQLRVSERILALENRLAARIDDLEVAHERLARDLSHAAEVQRACMPTSAPDLPGAQFAWYAETCAQLGGDLFNVLPLDDDHMAIYALDVSGHGTPAALYSVSLSHVLHGEADRGGLLRRKDGSLTPPAELATELNRRFLLMARSGHYFTLLYGVLQISSRRFEFVRAGQPHPIVLSGGEARMHVGGGGVPIGAMPDANHRGEALVLGAGESLLIATDGVFETRNADGDELGLQRVLEALHGAGHGPQQSVETLRLTIEEFRKTEPNRDDITFVCAALD